MPFVIDNPVVCGWFIRQQASAYGDAIAKRLQDDRSIAPAIWELELANVMRTACLRQRLTAEQPALVGKLLLNLGLLLASRVRALTNELEAAHRAG